jgi:hypothetical protein
MAIKISELGNLASFSDTTLFPVVNTANAYITVKSTGLTLKNYIFSNVANIAATGLTVTGNVVAGNVSGTYLSGTLLTAAQPNITSVGALTSLAVTGNVTAGNVSGTYLAGTLLTAAQPNITSVGVLATTSVSGNIFCTGSVVAAAVETNIFYESVNLVNVANTYTYSLSNTVTNNILIIQTSNPTATINMPTDPENNQITRISANANVILAVGLGNVSPSFAGANLLVSPIQYVYNSQYLTWFRV